MADYLTDTPCLEINYKSLAKQFSFGSAHTAENYVGYLRQAYLLIGLQKFSFKSRERIRNEKNYVIDTALISTTKEGFSEQNFGWRLENIVCIELFRRRNKTLNDVYYFKNSYEVDFVLVSNNKVVELIQVSSDISTQKTFSREVNALFNAGAELNCNTLTLITLNDDRISTVDNQIINIVSVKNWLLKNSAV
jgi:predicted AAA+ superfamily ATPase